MIRCFAAWLLSGLIGINAQAAYSTINEVEGKVLSYNEKTVTILQSGERVVIAKETIQNPKDIMLGKKVILKVLNRSSNKVEVPKDLKKTD